MNFRAKWVLFLATGGGMGNIPFAPGTIGSLWALPFSFLISKTTFSVTIFCIAVFIAFAIWIADEAEKIIQKKDPGTIVVDEISGLMVTFIGLPFNIPTVVTGFVVFRLLDILKPFPIRFIEKKNSGGLGIVLDDLVAGLCSNLFLRAVFLMTEK